MRSPPYLLFKKARSKQKLAKENPFPAGHPADGLFLRNSACSKVTVDALHCISACPPPLKNHFSIDVLKYKFSAK